MEPPCAALAGKEPIQPKLVVVPELTSLSPHQLAWAAGAGIDLHSSATEIGRLGFAYSPDSLQLILIFGLGDPGFGDRQHR